MKNLLYTLRWQDILDIAIVSFIIYRILTFLKGTRTLKILLAISVLLFATYFVTDFFQLSTLNWILSNVISSIFIILVIIFTPDIRRGLALLGRGALPKVQKHQKNELALDEILKAINSLSLSKIGALIVFEREDELNEYMEDATILNALVTKELILSIFHPATPLHDGAIIIRNGMVVAAGCFLPLTTRTDLSKSLGTRHRAAIGITEETDAVCVVVSEETGNVSVAVDGKITIKLDMETLEKLLSKLLFGTRTGKRK